MKAEVVDFESTAPPGQANQERPPYDGETTHFAGGGGGHSNDRSRNGNKRKTHDGSSLLSPSFGSSSPVQTNGGSGPPDSNQYCIRSFLSSSTPDGRPPATTQPTFGRSRETETRPAEEATRNRQVSGQRLGTCVAGGNTWGRRNDAAAGSQNEHGAGRRSFWSGRGGGRRGRPPVARGGQRGGRKKGRRGSIGKDAGDRMGQALAEWAWGYFCTPWGTAEEDDLPAGGSSAVGGAGLRSLPLASPSQLREPDVSGPAVAAPCAVGGSFQRPEPTGWRGLSAPPPLSATTSISSSPSPPTSGASAVAALSGQQQGRRNEPADASFVGNDGGNRQAAGPGRPHAISAAAAAAAIVNTSGNTRKARPPPPLYFQHDGHSRSVVGVLWPGGKATRRVNHGSGRGEGGGTGGRTESAGHGGRGERGGRGAGGKRQPGSLIVFDPSHSGKEIRNALNNTQTQGWGR